MHAYGTPHSVRLTRPFINQSVTMPSNQTLGRGGPSVHHWKFYMPASIEAVGMLQQLGQRRLGLLCMHMHSLLLLLPGRRCQPSSRESLHQACYFLSSLQFAAQMERLQRPWNLARLASRSLAGSTACHFALLPK